VERSTKKKLSPSLSKFLLLFSAVILVLASCGGGGGGSSPGDVTGDPTADPGTEFGSIRLNSVQSGFSAQTVFPDLGAFTDIDTYEIELTDGPGTDQAATGVADGNGDLSTPVVFNELIPGNWTITARGYTGYVNNANKGTLRVTGTSTVAVVAGTEATAAVTAAPVSDAGDGSWELTVRWPETIDFGNGYTVDTNVDAVEFNIDGAGWTDAGALTFDGTTGSVVIGEDPRPTGDFWLSVRLLHADRPYEEQFVYGERWYVYSGTLTATTLDLTDTELSYGGGAGITVSVETPSDLTNFFGGTPDSTVTVGQELTITADVAGATDYAWRLDGTTTGVTASSYTMPAPVDADAGKVRLIVLEVLVDGIWYSGSHYVRVEAQ
jgi:hypothetical protein